MAIPPYKLSNEELLSKARRTIEGINTTDYQKEVLSSIVNRFMYLIGDIESTNRWAKESFNENKRLIKLISERWKLE